MLHPMVVGSFWWMRSSLATSLNLTTLMVVQLESGAPLQAIKAKYQPSGVRLISSSLPCNHSCPMPCQVGRNKPFQFVQMCHNFARAWNFLREWEAAYGLFEWVVKVRPDILWFEPFPQFWGNLEETAVPRGVMTSIPRHQTLNDHVFVCQRNFCSHYFTAVSDQYSRTCESFRLPAVPQLALFEPSVPMRLLDVGYTLAKAGRQGPDCYRLMCNFSKVGAAGTGCVASHLQQFVPMCHKIASSW